MINSEEIKKVEEEEARILLEERKVEKDEKEIVKEEGEIIHEEKFLRRNLNRVISIERTLRDAAKTRAQFLRKFAKHKFIFSMISGIGVVLVWRGLWDVSEMVPGLESSVVALVVGMGILILLEKYTEL